MEVRGSQRRTIIRQINFKIYTAIFAVYLHCRPPHYFLKVMFGVDIHSWFNTVQLNCTYFVKIVLVEHPHR